MEGASFEIPSHVPASYAQASASKIDPRLQNELAALPDGKMASVIVTLKGAVDLQREAGRVPGAQRQEHLIRALQAQADPGQQEMRGFLKDARFAGKTGKATYFWIINGFALQATADVIQVLAARADVQSIEAEQIFQAPLASAGTAAAWDNLGKINARAMWALGFRGQGVVVANLDTGVEYTHPEFASRWRGGTNSWYDPADPAGSHPVPADLPAACPSSGHGTATMGVMVGNTVGVAPQAQWIAAKIFSDDATTDPLHPCPATTTSILSAFQWVLDPDGDPATPDAPQIVNSSWGAPGCDTSLVFQSALQALRAAGILPLFAAGNFGPTLGSSTYPGNYPEAFPVGATDSQDFIASFSSRGPNNCVQPAVTYPRMVAPGVDINTAGLGGGYTLVSGTSFSAPHAAGALALLLSASPHGLTLQQEESALQNSAVDLGAAGPDNIYGVGRLDVMTAYQTLVPRIGVSSTSQTVAENGGSLSLTVQLSRASDQPVTVDFVSAGGTAVAGMDYLLPGPVTFTPGEVQQSVQVAIVNDALPELDETFTVRLASPTNAVIADTASEVTITILDDDAQVGFAAGHLSVSEGAGIISIPVIRSGGLSGPVVSVDVRLALTGTAAPSIDFQFTAGSLSFSPGEVNQSIPVSIIDNHQCEPDKTFILELSNPQNGAIDASFSQIVVTIIENDPWQVFLPAIAR